MSNVEWKLSWPIQTVWGDANIGGDQSLMESFASRPDFTTVCTSLRTNSLKGRLLLRRTDFQDFQGTLLDREEGGAPECGSI